MICPTCDRPMVQYNRTSSYVCHGCGTHAERPAEPFRLSREHAERLVSSSNPNDPRVGIIRRRLAEGYYARMPTGHTDRPQRYSKTNPSRIRVHALGIKRKEVQG